MIGTVERAGGATGDNAAHEVMEARATEARATDASGLRLALMESRQRWRAFGTMAADLVFETDAGGMLSFLASDFVLGHPAARLLGTDPAALLLDPLAPNPFGRAGPRRRRAWLRGAGAPVCMEIVLEPMLDGLGHPCGMRGIGIDVTDRERRDVATAAALRRAEALDHILGRMRQEVLAPRMMAAILDQVLHAFGSEGALVADLAPGAAPPVLYAVGASLPAEALAAVLPHLDEVDDTVQVLGLPSGALTLCCQCTTRFGARVAAVTWRAAPARPWDDDDRMLAAAIMGVVRIVLERETIHRELARQARTDSLTGLLNRRAFLEEAARRLDRLEAEGLPGTLMFIDLDRLKQVNDSHGHEAGDGAITLSANLLTRTFRPTDLIARLGGDEFAVWLDGADTFTAAERAEALRLATPGELGHLTAGTDAMGMSIGIATRDPRSGENLEDLMNRADTAMYAAKHHGRGHWRVSQPGGPA